MQALSDKLYSAGTALSQVSESESASAEELAATSEQLVVSFMESDTSPLILCKSFNNFSFSTDLSKCV